MIKLSDSVEFRIKWSGPSNPYIEFDKNSRVIQITLTKADIKAIRDELTAFMNFYEDDFSKENINKTPPLDDYTDYND